MSKASDRAYRLIRAEILSGRLAPGFHLKEEELAELCGVSRTPVRDALRQLESEYYVSRAANQRTFVSAWTRGDIEDIFSLRAMLEGYAAERAATRITDTQIAEMETHHAAISAMLADGSTPDPDAFLVHNRGFHSVVTDAADSDRLTLMLSRLVEQPVVMRTFITYTSEDLQRSHQHHGELLSAFRARDASWARSVMTSHIQAAFHVHAKAIDPVAEAAE